MSQNALQTQNFDHLLKQHPCFNREAHFKYGRLHLPVSPDCNIQCRFCKRDFNKYENRPGVSRTLISPGEAVDIVLKALDTCPELKVVGIAGPGDTLATSHALKVFEKINARFPQIINCLSTNGLLLEENASRLHDAGVRTVTVTVNAVDPVILTRICSKVRYHDQEFTELAAARLLIEAQLAGIRKTVRLGMAVKINGVLIPGINHHHIGEIAEVVAGLGASLFNIIPLIPQHELIHHQPPDCRELNAAREAAEKHLPVFRHCRHCRADAFGIPGQGEELSEKLYHQSLDTFSHG